ncbi:MAG: hypothetical protein ACRDI2_25610 [Chloroflexota bacterium]
MPSRAQDVERIVAEVERLSPEDRLRLVQRVVETFVPPARPLKKGQRLEYGKYRHGRLSTEEDVKLAEWHPEREES